MDKLEVYNLFIEFLTRNKAYERYIDHTFHLISIERIVIDQPAENWITAAFDWWATPEGIDYWRDLHLKWKQLLKDINY